MFGRYKLYCKIFGERNTGTHFLSACLNENFVFKKLDDADVPGAAGRPEYFPGLRNKRAAAEIREMIAEAENRRTMESDFGWKHAAPPLPVMRKAEFSKETLFIFLVKDPVSWTTSLYNRDYHNVVAKPASIVEFVNTAWVLRPRDNLGIGYLSSPVCLWNEKVRRYREAMVEFPANSVLVRYEDLLTDFEGQMNTIAGFLLKRPEIVEFAIRGKSTKKDPMNYADYQRKYAEKKLDCPPGLIDAIAGFIDAPLADSLGYNIDDWRRAAA